MDEIFEKLEKYNFWHGEAIRAGFARRMYLEKIDKYIGNDLVKVLVGQRRVGKSYILRQIIQTLISQKINPKNIFYLNKELVDFDSIRTYKDLAGLVDEYIKKLKPKGKIYILLDEIQEIEQWEKTVNSFSQDYKQQYEVFITGSNSNLLSGELATYLSGRSVSFEIFPFLFEEYAEYFNFTKSRETYLSYLQTGGLPELYILGDEETRIHYISSLKNTILLKDIVARFNIKDVNLLEDLFRFLMDNIGNLFSISSIVNYLDSNKRKTNYETVSNYIEYLKQSFLIYEAERYDIKGKSLLAGSRKYYLNDLSFRRYLSSGFNEGLGQSLENSLYIYFRAKGYKIYVGTVNGEEVDFILEKDGEKKYVQVTYLLSTKQIIGREFGSLEKISDSYEKVVVSLDDAAFGNREGIKHLRPWEIC